MAMFLRVPRVATQPLRVRRHFEWVSRMLATTMGAVMKGSPVPRIIGRSYNNQMLLLFCVSSHPFHPHSNRFTLFLLANFLASLRCWGLHACLSQPFRIGKTSSFPKVPETEPHPKPSSKRFENASLAILFNHL